MVILDNLGLVLVGIQVGLDIQAFQAILVGLVLVDIQVGLGFQVLVVILVGLDLQV